MGVFSVGKENFFIITRNAISPPLMMLEYVIVLTLSHGQDVERKNKINNNTIIIQSSFLLSACGRTPIRPITETTA